MDNPASDSSDLCILAIDVGGSGIKASVLDADGNPKSERVRVKSPHPCPPGVLLDTICTLVEPFKESNYNRISVGFPGVVRRGIIVTAPNLGTDALREYPLADELSKRLGQPVRLINDADMQGLAVVKGHGVEVVLTLGTGMGSAIFSEGQLGPHLELSHHPFRKGETYEEQVGVAALEKIGKKKWNRRVQKVIATLRVLTNFDHLYLGGGNAKELTFKLDPDVELVNNENGIRGGAWLWRQNVKPA